MFDLSVLNTIPPQVIGLLVVWEAFWKSVGLWYAIKGEQRNWFVAMFVINTVGILPIVYLLFFRKKGK